MDNYLDNLHTCDFVDNLVVEMPLKEKDVDLQLPIIADAEEGGKKVNFERLLLKFLESDFKI